MLLYGHMHVHHLVHVLDLLPAWNMRFTQPGQCHCCPPKTPRNAVCVKREGQKWAQNKFRKRASTEKGGSLQHCDWFVIEQAASIESDGATLADFKFHSRRVQYGLVVLVPKQG